MCYTLVCVRSLKKLLVLGLLCGNHTLECVCVRVSVWVGVCVLKPEVQFELCVCVCVFRMSN